MTAKVTANVEKYDCASFSFSPCYDRGDDRPVTGGLAVKVAASVSGCSDRCRDRDREGAIVKRERARCWARNGPLLIGIFRFHHIESYDKTLLALATLLSGNSSSSYHKRGFKTILDDTRNGRESNPP